MRYLFVVGHPAHVHLFKNVIRSLRERGHATLVGAVAREVTTRLLEAFEIPHFVFGRSRTNLLSKALDLLPKDLALLTQARKFRPDMIVSTGSPYGAHVSALLSKPHLIFGDTEHATLIADLTLPFSDAVCTPEAFQGDLGPKHIRYNGYKEIAYLHPNYFAPDPRILDDVGLSASEPYIILRFSAWDASHDVGDHGFALRGDDKILGFCQGLERLGKVVAIGDRPISRQLERYDLKIPPESLHDVLAFAQLYVGEGATMAAEAGVLGVPWIFVSTTSRGFLDEQARRYNLGYWVTRADDALHRARTLLSEPNLRANWRARRDSMLLEKIDVVQFILKFIEGWPDSLRAARMRGARRLHALGIQSDHGGHPHG